MHELEDRDQMLRLGALRSEHRRLDAELDQLRVGSCTDQVMLMRMKKRKLRLRDEIHSLENSIIPDIIA